MLSDHPRVVDDYLGIKKAPSGVVEAHLRLLEVQ
jgi:hypothetical protein